MEPIVDCGRYPTCRVVGDRVDVTATIFKDGHDALGAAIRVKGPRAKKAREEPLVPLGNDRYGGTFAVDAPGLWSFTVSPGPTASRPGRTSCGASRPEVSPTSPASSPRARRSSGVTS